CRVRKLSLVSHHRGDFVSARKRCSENALAGVAGGAQEKDFHNRTSSFITQVLTLHGSARPSSASPRRGNVRSRPQCPLYPPKADMCGATRDVRFGPKADIRAASKKEVADRAVRS